MKASWSRQIGNTSCASEHGVFMWVSAWIIHILEIIRVIGAQVHALISCTHNRGVCMHPIHDLNFVYKRKYFQCSGQLLQDTGAKKAFNLLLWIWCHEHGIFRSLRTYAWNICWEHEIFMILRIFIVVKSMKSAWAWNSHALEVMKGSWCKQTFYALKITRASWSQWSWRTWNVWWWDHEGSTHSRSNDLENIECWWEHEEFIKGTWFQQTFHAQIHALI